MDLAKESKELKSMLAEIITNKMTSCELKTQTGMTEHKCSQIIKSYKEYEVY